MSLEPISKPPASWRVIPDLKDYAATRAAFSWEAVRGELAGLPEGQGFNAAYEAVDRDSEIFAPIFNERNAAILETERSRDSMHP